MEPELLAMLTEGEQEAVRYSVAPIVEELARSLAEARQQAEKVEYWIAAERKVWESELERAEAQVKEMQREGCAAIDTLEDIFNDLTSPQAIREGVNAKLAKKMAEAAANTAAVAERCEHKAQVERLIRLLRAADEDLGRAIEDDGVRDERVQDAHDAIHTEVVAALTAEGGEG